MFALLLMTLNALAGMHVVADAAYRNELPQLLDSATASIDLVQFEFFAESGYTRGIADQLIRLKKERPGLKIRLMLEGDKDGIGSHNAATRDLLVPYGIEVQLDSADRVTHAKVVLVDGRRALFGSHNLTNNSLFNNNETSLYVEDENSGAAIASWIEALHEKPARPVPIDDNTGLVRILADTAYSGAALELIRNAKHSINVSMYYLTEMNMLEELKAASFRGVKIRVLLEQSSSFSPHITEANRKTAAWLTANNVAEIHFDSPTQITHTKLMLVDDTHALLGSTNWYSKDFDENHQMNAEVSEPVVVASLNSLFESKWATN